MARMLARTMTLSAIVEPGTAETTTFNSANLLFRNLNVVEIDSTFVDLQELRTTLTKSGDVIGRQLIRLTPGFTLQSHAGAPSTYRLGRIFRMCGMEESLSGSTATYKFRSSGYESGAVSFHENAVTGSGVLYRATSVFGNAVFNGTAGQPITVDATLTGLYQDPIAQLAPTPSAPANNIATMKGENLTVTPAGGGPITPICKSFTLDLGNEVSEDSDFNAANALGGLFITNRNPTMQLVIGLDSADALTWYANLKNTTHHTVVWTHTDADGGKTKFTVKGQLQGLPKGEETGFRTVTLNYVMRASTAEGELEIQCTGTA